jgi:osmotically-inducible protein OsmY
MDGELGLTVDQRIAEAVEREIQSRLPPKAPPITVGVEGATVTLTGHVANQATKEALIKMAKDTPGVVDVDDELKIGRKSDTPFLDWIAPWRDPDRDLTHSTEEW